MKISKEMMHKGQKDESKIQYHFCHEKDHKNK